MMMRMIHSVSVLLEPHNTIKGFIWVLKSMAFSSEVECLTWVLFCIQRSDFPSLQKAEVSCLALSWNVSLRKTAGLWFIISRSGK